MLVPLSMALTIACAALYLSINSREEIVKVVASAIAIICAFLSLFFAPWLIKLVILAVPLVIEKLASFASR